MKKGRRFTPAHRPYSYPSHPTVPKFNNGIRATIRFGDKIVVDGDKPALPISHFRTLNRTSNKFLKVRLKSVLGGRWDGR
jgi:hypothetical protein